MEDAIRDAYTSYKEFSSYEELYKEFLYYLHSATTLFILTQKTAFGGEISLRDQLSTYSLCYFVSRVIQFETIRLYIQFVRFESSLIFMVFTDGYKRQDHGH